MATGDVLLFEEKSFGTGDIFGDLVVEFTHGPFVHSEVQTDDTHSIGEIELGLEAHPIPTTYKSVVTIPIQGAIETGLAWVGGQNLAALQHKRPYGFASLANAAFKMLHLPLRIAIPNEWDCSEFVTLYLEQARAVPPTLAALLSDRSAISPNDIARAFGILPPESNPTLMTSTARAAYR